MSIKKFFATICAASLLIAGCGSDNAAKVDETSQEAIIKLGMITHLNASEKQMEEYFFKVQEKSRAKVLNHVPKFYDNLNLMIMGIESNHVDQISVYECVADYLMVNNNKFEVAKADWISGLEDNFCFAVKHEDTALTADLNKVLDEMKSDGSLNKMIDEYIINVDKGKTPPAIELPKFDGAETIKIGVTGDLPPLDFVSADGKPAGFNTALLAEIAKRLNKNIEIIQVESGARAAALNSDQIDVVFWAIVPVSDVLPADVDKPEGIDLSNAYFKDKITHLKLKE